MRSCTCRDALPGIRKEVWLSPLLGGDYAVLLFNKGGREELVQNLTYKGLTT